ncbi:putative cofD-like protein [Brevibacterium sanguinis]|uniref:Putative gluconeogenesis factor n=2 Tax=Brevibacterium TaxID=1696 RepID=A0A366IL77_9MICO|nr:MULTISPECIES: uridine diphosphate-N-acetylglucosamine-binding protein YvcK [Brevibacterium]RBP64623.1 putative cofD-like protein [Brevibacterium sanguinis]RBP71734.1 putative cofD-like protein [Brevibacterium celere]
MKTEDLPQISPAVKDKGPKIVSFGGGHGLYAALRAFRLLTESLTAVVTVADDGGSSGRLRDELGGLPPGDLRMALAALCDDGNWGRTWRDVIQHRFASTGDLNGHSVGNLLIAALWQIHGDHVAGLDWMAKLLRAHGRVLPMSSVPLTIEADVRFADSFQVVRGQSVLASTRGHVESVRLDPAAPPARYETVEAVAESDVLNLGPGSWYTSVMPHLLVPSLAQAIERSAAVKSLTLNLGSSDGETRDLSLGEHLVSLHRHAPRLVLDYVLVDEAAVRAEPDLAARAEDMFSAKLWVRPLSSRRAGQHDSLKLAACYRDMLIDAGIDVDEQW